MILRIRARIWNCGIKLWWYRLWIRADEFHPSLMIDDVALAAMSYQVRYEYLADLALRRKIAHLKSLEASCNLWR